MSTWPFESLKLQALANLAYEMNAKSVALISSSRASVHTFLEDATALGIRVPHILELETLNKKSKSSELPQKVEKFLRTLPTKRPVVAVVLEAVEAVAIAEYLKHVKLPSDPTWLVGSLGLDLHKLSAWRTVFHGGLFVEPHMPELAEFKTYFIDALQVLLKCGCSDSEKKWHVVKKLLYYEIFSSTKQRGKNGYYLHCREQIYLHDMIWMPFFFESDSNTRFCNSA